MPEIEIRCESEEDKTEGIVPRFKIVKDRNLEKFSMELEKGINNGYHPITDLKVFGDGEKDIYSVLLENGKFLMEMKQIHLSISEKQNNELEKLSNKLGGVAKNNLIRLALADLLHKYKDFE